jgi:hypothetical protein
MTRCRALVVLPLLLLAMLPARVAVAHIPQLRGRLIDLVGRSDLIVIATVENTKRIDTRLNETTARVEARLAGDTQDARLTFRSQPRFATGRRVVVFLRRTGSGFECVQASGTVFPARPEDDASYRDAVEAIRQALRADEAGRAARLRAALIPALSASAPPLRYYALLDLASLTHHGLTEAERRALEGVLADASTDPAIRPVIASLLKGAGTSTPGAVGVGEEQAASPTPGRARSF